MAIFPGAVATDSDLYVAVNQKSTLLTDNPLSDVATTVNVTSTSGFPSVGFISIDSEIIKYTGTTATSFTGCTRGADGTTAAVHTLNATVYHNVIAAHHNATKDEIKATQQFISDLVGLSTTQIAAPVGTVSAPGYSFSGDLNTGMFRSAADTLELATNGTSRMYVASTGAIGFGRVPTVAAAGGIESSDRIYSNGGSAGNPGFSKFDDSNTGIELAGSDVIHIVTGGSRKVTIDSGGTSTFVEAIREKDGSAAAPAYTFSNDSDTGLYSAVANALGVTCGGVDAIRVDNSATADQTRLLVYDVSAASLVRVTRGAADSGGSGFRVLRIPN